MYATEEERLKALRASRNEYQKNKEWYRDICHNGKNYTIGGKTHYEKTKKHLLNSLLLEKAEISNNNFFNI